MRYDTNFLEIFGLTGCRDNKYYKACRAIEKELKKRDINTEVCRHELFGVNYYLLTIKNNSLLNVKRKLADALKIPIEWIDFYAYPNRYVIKEDEFNNKYMNNDELCFFNFWKAMDSALSGMLIEQQLDMDNVTVACYPDFVLIKNAHYSASVIAEKLCIPSAAVEDISLEGTPIKHIVLLDKIPKDC